MPISERKRWARWLAEISVIVEADRGPEHAADVQALPHRRRAEVDVVAHDEHRARR